MDLQSIQRNLHEKPILYSELTGWFAFFCFLCFVLELTERVYRLQMDINIKKYNGKTNIILKTSHTVRVCVFCFRIPMKRFYCLCVYLLEVGTHLNKLKYVIGIELQSLNTQVIAKLLTNAIAFRERKQVLFYVKCAYDIQIGLFKHKSQLHQVVRIQAKT